MLSIWEDYLSRLWVAEGKTCFRWITASYSDRKVIRTLGVVMYLFVQRCKQSYKASEVGLTLLTVPIFMHE